MLQLLLLLLLLMTKVILLIADANAFKSVLLTYHVNVSGGRYS
jgi:hypothetical protein